MSVVRIIWIQHSYKMTEEIIADFFISKRSDNQIYD